MAGDRRLACVSGAQLGAGVLGMAIVVRRRHHYDFLFMRGRPERVRARHRAHGNRLLGATHDAHGAGGGDRAAVARTEPPGASVVAGLGIAMVPGYLGEKLVRRRLTPSGYDRVETPVVIAGITLASMTALLGATSLRR